MHQRPSDQHPQRQAPNPGAAIWLLAGTGEGPRLAAALLAAGWWVRVSVVGPEAARAYRPHPRLDVRPGALADASAVEQGLEELRPRWLVDATHPFALQISALLQQVCAARRQPWLALQRPPLAVNPTLRLRRIPQLAALAELDLSAERLLLAIGSRHLPAALAASNASAHFARVLDRPTSLQLALAAGLPDQQLACLRPGTRGDGAVERALCRRWRISAVLCRASGGAGEALWHSLCADLGLRLLLLERPLPAAHSGRSLPLAALLKTLGQPD